MMTSFLIKKDSIDIRWEYEIDKKEIGEIVGSDQGLKTTLTLVLSLIKNVINLKISIKM